MTCRSLCLLILFGFCSGALAQSAMAPARSEQKQKEQQAVGRQQEKTAQHSAVIQFEGGKVFTEKQLRSQLKEEISTINDFGLTAARADDVAFFLELVYRKHGYTKVSVRYVIESGDRLKLIINEGPLQTLGSLTFSGNAHQPADKLFDYVVGPTRQRYGKMQKALPFVAADISEGADLVRRLYVGEGYLDAVVDKPRFDYHEQTNQVDVVIPIQEGRQYLFGNVIFEGNTVYDAETLRGQVKDLIEQPYTEARVADIPRRLQAYFKARGYYAAKVQATGSPDAAADGRVLVRVAISAGGVYHFGEVNVTGLQRLHPSYVEKRFTSLNGKPYSPDVLDQKFRILMRSGLFSLLQINPVAEAGETLDLQISAEEAKSKQLGFSAGYGTYEGFIGGISFRELNLFGYGRPLTTSVEVSQRSYKGEILFEDPYLFDSEFALRTRLAALTFDFDGYSKFELGGRLEFSRQLTKQYQAGVIFSARHVEITSADIKSFRLGDTSYFINTIGFTQTLDFRESPLVAPRGFVADNTFDIATSGLGSDINLVRGTLRLAYYIPFAPRPLAPGIVEDRAGPSNPWEKFFQQSSLALGARVGLVHSLNHSGPDEPNTIPIDERFFNGGADTVRSFGERDLGPLDRHDDPLGGEFFTVFNVEYTVPIYGELQGAAFFDAGNLLPTSEHPGLNEMRYAIGLGLRYRLPIGPIRLDYGFNPDPGPREDSGAFHFSFGFAF
ncbi:MAG TPA: BamA/TamA family outer membrane protein [Chthoniobacterales bacterium]